MVQGNFHAVGNSQLVKKFHLVMKLEDAVTRITKCLSLVLIPSNFSCFRVGICVFKTTLYYYPICAVVS